MQFHGSDSGNHNNIKGLFLLGLMSLFTVIAFGQEVKTTLKPSKIQIGDHVLLTFTTEVPASARMEFPLFNEKINEKTEILNYGTLDTIVLEDKSLIGLKRQLIITSWEEGLHPIIPFEFLLISVTDTLILESEPVLLEVDPYNLDENADLKDIKNILSIPLTFAEVFPWVLLFVVVVVTAALLHHYLKKRKKKQPLKDSIWEKPDIPAHVAAFSSFEKLRAQKLWQQGKVKLYYIELTDILRHYIEKRFSIRALEMTTDETMYAIVPQLENHEIKESLKAILQLADLVKFAKHIPREAENESCMDNAIEFVKDTMIRVTESEPAKDVKNT